MIFGVHGPVLCLIADPIVFKSDLISAPLLADYQFFAYLVAAIEVPLLAIWLLHGARFKSAALVIGGALMAGAFFSFLIGMAILPFSLLGLVFLIGIFGFTPFLAALVYLRNAIRAIRAQPKGLSLPSGFVLAGIAAAYAIGLPAIVSVGTARVSSVWVSDVLYGDERTATTAAHRLSWLPVVPDKTLHQLLSAYEGESNADRRKLLARHYREIGGEEIENRRRRSD
jgi:hypothetical protein